MNKQVLLESLFIGFIFMISTAIVMVGLHRICPNDYTGCLYLPNKSSIKYYVATFISGFMANVFCEYVGINEWYCKNGNACIKKTDR